MTSCVAVRKAIYFNDLPDTISTPIVMSQPAKFADPKIESNDILAINVQTIIQNATNPISTNTTGSFSALNGYLVDKNGYIELPLMGFVKMAGLTTPEARELIKQKAKEFFKDPVVNVRIANFDIVILGDVGHPGTVTVPSEKVSIFDAIALSGDINLTARRDNVLITRIVGEERQFARLDLTSSKIYQSPYYYLKQHDQIYVQPGRNKIQASDNTLIRNLGIISSMLSLTSLILIFRNIK
jgi:polysaccharide export outer membrane protein